MDYKLSPKEEIYARWRYSSYKEPNTHKGVYRFLKHFMINLFSLIILIIVLFYIITVDLFLYNY